MHAYVISLFARKLTCEEKTRIKFTAVQGTTMPSVLVSLLVILVSTLPSTYYLYNYPSFHSCAWPNPAAPFRLLALADPQIEGDKKQKSWRGRIDIWGN